jgi:autotransporter-like protein/HYDIN/CFA65/VesB family protein
MAHNLKNSWATTCVMRVVKQVLVVPTALLFGITNAWAADWINPSVTPSAVADGVCLAGPFANATSANVSVQWTALNTDAGPGRSLLLVKWNEAGGAITTTGALFANAPVGQLPTQTTVVNVNDVDMIGTTAYFALRDVFSAGEIWSDSRSPQLPGDLTATAGGNAGYASIDMSADPDCVGVPEINVTGSTVNIVDGDSFPSLSDGTNFGTIAHVSGTVSRTFTIENTGNGTLTLGANAVTIAGTNAADFTVTSQPATTVAAAGSTSVTVQFDPSALGTRTATLSIANDDGDENPYNFAIGGTGGGSPEINLTGNGQNIVNGDVTPGTGDHTNFGSIDINDGHIERIFTVENTGDATLTLGASAVSLSGADAADFSVIIQPFSIVSGGTSRTFRIRFDPSAAGAKSATVTIANDDIDESPYSFAISGTATSAPEIEVRLDNGIEVSNGNSHVAYRVASLSFNVASGTRTYTINNVGSDTLTVAGVTFTGTHAAEFDIVTPPAASIAPGGTTSFTARFTQTTSGIRTVNINITNNDADESAFTFGSSGFRFAGPDLDITGQGIDIVNGDTTPRPEDDTDFGSVNVASGFVEHSFTGTNNGDTSISISSITVTGAHASDFSVTTGTGFAPLTVRFDPSAVGMRTATVNVASNALVDNPFTFAVQGTGTVVAPEIAVSSSEGGAIADGGTDTQGNETATATKTVTYTVDNSAGTDTLSVTNIATSNLSNVTSATPSTTTLNIAAGATGTFTVDYVPTLAGAFSFDLDITNNDGDEGNYDITVSGTGVGNAEINVLAGITVPIADNPAHDPASISGTRLDTTVGGASTLLYTIENTGTDVLTLGANAVSLSGTGIGDFSVSLQPATTVAPGATTSFRIRFAATSAGLQGPVDVAINNDDADENPYNFRVQGLGREIEMDVTGNGQAIADNPAHTPGASDHTDFGSVDIAAGSVTRTFTIENNGVGFFLQPDPNAVSLAGAHAADFTVSVQPATSVDVGLTTTFQIVFDPSTSGLRGPVDVSITSNDPDESPYNFRIQGTGTSAPEISLSGNGQNIVDGDTTPATSDHTEFGTTDITSGTVSRSFTIENTGSATLTLGANAATLSGANAADFQVTAQPATTIVPAGSSILTVQFDPSALGARTAILSIANDDSDEGPFNFVISGTGSGAGEINLVGNSQSITDGDTTPDVADHTNFGTFDITTGAISRTFTIQNTGTDILTLGANAASLSGAGAADFAVTAQPAVSVAASGSTSVTVRFDPSALGARVATLTIANDDSNEGPYDFAISGNGTGAPEISLRGNGHMIVSGDTSASLADHTDFGPADRSAGQVSRTFTIENTGTDVLTLGANAVSLSGPNAGDFSVTTQPAASVAPASSTSVIVQFDPSALGSRAAVLTIVNNDADESPYSFALSGTGVDGGTVTIVQNITGADVSTRYSSTTPALNFSLTSVSGIAQTSLVGVPAGTHALLAEDLSAIGYGISAITCDDTDSVGDVANRKAAINLTSGEHVTCTFEAIDTRGPTSQIIADFLGGRSALLLANQPGNDRRINRLKAEAGVSGGDSFRAFGHNLRSPLPVDLSIDDHEFSFATSLKRLMAAGGKASLGTDGPANGSAQETSPIDIWIEGSVSRFIDGTSGGGSFGLLSFGVDYLLEADVLIGFMGQYDRFKQDLNGAGRHIDGTGWMAGPYATVKLDEHLYLDVAGAWGQSDNEISPFGTYTDTFETERGLLSSSLTGQFEVANWEISPKYTLQFFHERQFAYSDSLGVVIPEQSYSQGDMRLGPQVAYVYTFQDGSSFRPTGGFDGVYTFGERNAFSSGSFAAENQGFTGRMNAGFNYRDRDGLKLGARADYGGIGGSAKSFGFTIDLNVPLN